MAIIFIEGAPTPDFPIIIVQSYKLICNYSCGLSTTTIEYSCVSVCVSVCLSVYTITQKNGSIHLKLEIIVAYENSSDEFDIGHCLIKVKVTA